MQHYFLNLQVIGWRLSHTKQKNQFQLLLFNRINDKLTVPHSVQPASKFLCLNGLAPPYLCQKFKTRSEVHNRNTRNRHRLHIPLCRMAAGQRAFTFRGQRLWNSLPDEFHSITNLDVFKVKIKQHFLRVFLEN